MRAFCSPPPPPPSASHTAAEPARKALGGGRHARGGVRLEAASTSHMSQCFGETPDNNRLAARFQSIARLLRLLALAGSRAENSFGAIADE